MALPDGGRDRAPLPATDGPFKVGHVWSPDGLRIGLRSNAAAVFRGIGHGPLVILCHGWPEIWYSWRRVMPALAEAGFHVVAPDLRGFGDSDHPTEPHHYTLKKSCADLVAIIDHFEQPFAILIGHDWGGALVWRFALHHPTRLRAVASICTPFVPRLPVYLAPRELAELDRTLRHVWLVKATCTEYQAYFNEGHAAEAELEEDVDRTLRCLLRSTRKADHIPGVKGGMTDGKFIAALGNPPRSDMFTAEEHARYVEAYKRTGFTSTLNWYRTSEQNWLDEAGLPMVVPHPALMVLAGRDRVLRPSLADGMEAYVPNLKRALIAEAGHWVSNEQPQQLTEVLLRWLRSLTSNKL